MIWPPAIMRIRVVEKQAKRVRLWLPLFLLWPLIALTGLVAPIVVMAIPHLRRNMKTTAILASGPLMLLLFCRLRGFRVDVQDGRDVVHVSFT